MRDRDLLVGYMKQLVKMWYLWVLIFVDFVGAVIQPLFSFEIPRSINFAIFVVVFLYANFRLYRDDQLKLAELVQSHDQSMQEMKDRLALAENRSPVLELFLKQDGNLEQHAELTIPCLSTEQGVEADLKQERQELASLYDRYYSASVEEREKLHPDALSFRGKNRDQYDKECRRYLEEYLAYLNDRHERRVTGPTIRSLNFALVNSGRATAEKVVAVIRFPQTVRPLSPRELEQRRDNASHVPRRPEPFQVMSRSSSSVVNSLSNYGLHSATAAKNSETFTGPFFDSDSSESVTYRLEELLHNFENFGWEPVIVAISHDILGQTVELQYSVHAANLATPHSDVLTMKVICQEQEP